VPPKVNVFTWKLARNALPTRKSKFQRNIEHQDTCKLCGLTAETSFHGTAECPQAYNLRQAMRVHWPLPGEEYFTYTGPDWLLLLLDRCKPEQRDLTKLLLWRIWTVHNNIVHESGPSDISDSVFFLRRLRENLAQVKAPDVKVSSQGKEHCNKSDNKEVAVVPRWEGTSPCWLV
jgi:hypothetical protein